MRKTDNKIFAGYVKSMSDQKRTFMVGKKRVVKKIIINDGSRLGKLLIANKNKNHVKSKEKSSTINSLLGQVSRAVSRFILKSGLEIEKIKQVHPAVAVSRKKYRLMKDGAKFYYVDINHCFWRIAFLKGYIGEKLYEKWANEQGELKTFRNMSLGCIKASEGRTYYIRGVRSYEIEEDKTLQCTIYDNIRFTCYNFLGEISKEVGDNFIAYKTDGIMVDNKKGLAKVKKLMKKNNFMFTVKECEKIDELTYRVDGTTKRM
jgi:hypothetical protein